MPWWGDGSDGRVGVRSVRILPGQGSEIEAGKQFQAAEILFFAEFGARAPGEKKRPRSQLDVRYSRVQQLRRNRGASVVETGDERHCRREVQDVERLLLADPCIQITASRIGTAVLRLGERAGAPQQGGVARRTEPVHAAFHQRVKIVHLALAEPGAVPVVLDDVGRVALAEIARTENVTGGVGAARRHYAP